MIKWSLKCLFSNHNKRLFFFQIFIPCLALLACTSPAYTAFVETRCTRQATGSNLNNYPVPDVNSIAAGGAAANAIPNRGKRDTSYNAPTLYTTTTEAPKVHNPGKVIVMPPPGKAPVGYPQPGEPGGGALPETNPYVANMAPYGTVPIAIYPPFEKEPVYPTRCVIYSQLNDFEDLDEEYKVILTSGILFN